MSDFEAEAVVNGLIGVRAFRESEGAYVWIWDGRCGAWYRFGNAPGGRPVSWSDYDLAGIVRQERLIEIAVPDWFRGHEHD